MTQALRSGLNYPHLDIEKQLQLIKEQKNFKNAKNT